MRYCTLCKRYIEPVKNRWSWAWFIILCFTGFGGIGYALYHIIMKKKKRCSICYTKQLTKYSPGDAETKKLEKEEKREERKQLIKNTKNKFIDTINGDGE
ncbi:hypothetical protein [Anaeromicrobium sediminis]|uniref:Uncharacterized protein n=1 Tax=Anaeromicrobium sediminis TaxID=1478221 RepID=A0A267MN50_9FIRM|nr:hypothetical protein [Anaeromicrobium sediminis]PAB61009.1 hypothetical protein CCE28_00835 [Anaeromicrobium sediminis]